MTRTGQRPRLPRLDPEQLAFDVSIVATLRDEGHNVEMFLDGLAALDLGESKVEVLIAEGGSKDDTRSRLEEDLPRVVEQRPEIGWRLIENASASTPAGLNACILASRGSVIVRMDGHTVYPPDHVRACLRALAESGADNVGGVVHARHAAETDTARAIAFARSDLFGAGNSPFRRRSTNGPKRTVPFGCFPRETFVAVGLYDLRLRRNQDLELNHRIRAAGDVVYLDDRIVSEYLTPATFGSLFRKHFLNGVWNVRASAVAPGCIGWFHFVPGMFVFALLVLTAVSPLSGGLLFLGFAGVDLLRSALVGAGVSRVRLALAFAAIQVGHGLGQVIGVLGVPFFLVANR